jgi:hypothetical protein
MQWTLKSRKIICYDTVLEMKVQAEEITVPETAWSEDFRIIFS